MIEILLVIIFIYFIIRLINQTGKAFPIFELVVVLYLLQYCIAPLLEYKISPQNSMSLGMEEYLGFATFSCIAFILGLYSVKNKFKKIQINISSEFASSLGRWFIVISLFASLLNVFFLYSFKAILTFFIILKFTGIYCLIYSDKKLDKIIIIVLFIQLIANAILESQLINFIVFLIFFAMFYNIKYTMTTKSKLVIVSLVLLFLTVYQGVKSEYRDLTWTKGKSWQSNLTSEEKLAILSNLITFDSFFKAFETKLENNETLIKTVHRLNQGWQTSKVLKHVPKHVDFENGKALMIDIFSSVMPRFLLPNKRVVNDHKRFNYYTGYTLNNQTSMSIGVIGDFYINFGFYGTIISMFVFGHCVARFIFWFYKKYIIYNPFNIIWLPFFLSYFIRPGNEFYMVLNHIIKSFIVFLIVRRFLYVYLNKKFNNKITYG